MKNIVKTLAKKLYMLYNIYSKTAGETAEEKMEKIYPINFEKHGHDFQYVSNILGNRAYDLRNAGKDEKADALEEKQEKITETIGKIVKSSRAYNGDRIFWYRGKDYAFLRNVIEFAHNSRAYAIAKFMCENK